MCANTSSAARQPNVLDRVREAVSKGNSAQWCRCRLGDGCNPSPRMIQNRARWHEWACLVCFDTSARGRALRGPEW